MGNSVIYVGSKTGRDGLGGAVMASDSFNDENKSLRPTVQVGDPFAEKLLMEACLELFKTDFVVGIQDMGAAGLTSSSFEMAGRSGSGMKMHLDRVPMRESGMTPYELMLSESQERMLICAKKGCEDKIKEIFAKWDLDAEVIGEVTNTGKMELYWHGELAGVIPIEPLSEAAPVLDRPTKRPAYLDEIANFSLCGCECNTDNNEAFDKMFSEPEILNKNLIYDQYDANIGTNTIKQPGTLGAFVMRVKENGVNLAMGMDCNTRMNFVNPKVGGALAVAVSGRKVALSGATPLAITDCLNYGNPQNPEVMWQFAQGCEGIKEACKELNTPVVSGNVSLYNETEGVSIQPTPAIVTVGVNKNANLPSHFVSENVAVYLVGETKGVFAGSLYMKTILNKIGGVLPNLDYKKELNLWNLAIKGNEQGIFKFANSVGVGGVAITLAKMACVGKMGGEFKMPCDDKRDIFDESFSRAIFGVSDEAKFENLAKSLGLSFVKLGRTGEKKFVINDVCKDLSKMREIYYNKFSEIIRSED